MKLDISDDEYRRIEKLIESDASPVGIDAKKTHIIILHKLAAIERRLESLEHTCKQGIESQSTHKPRAKEKS